jgi:hypothetical protein
LWAISQYQEQVVIQRHFQMSGGAKVLGRTVAFQLAVGGNSYQDELNYLKIPSMSFVMLNKDVNH